MYWRQMTWNKFKCPSIFFYNNNSEVIFPCKACYTLWHFKIQRFLIPKPLESGVTPSAFMSFWLGTSSPNFLGNPELLKWISHFPSKYTLTKSKLVFICLACYNRIPQSAKQQTLIFPSSGVWEVQYRDAKRVRFLIRAFFLACRWLSSYCFLTGCREKGY